MQWSIYFEFITYYNTGYAWSFVRAKLKTIKLMQVADQAQIKTNFSYDFRFSSADVFKLTRVF
jgi:hypothetical protein